MKVYISPGRVIRLTAPIGGVVSGNWYVIGALGVLACGDAAAGDSFNGATEGVYLVSKPTDDEWTEGERIYWDADAELFTTESSGNLEVGVAVDDVGASVPTGRVRLNGQPPSQGGGSGIELLDEDPPNPATGGIVYFLVVGGKLQLRVIAPTGDPGILFEEE